MKSTSAGALSSGCRRRGEGLRHPENPAGSALTLWMRVLGLRHGCVQGLPRALSGKESVCDVGDMVQSLSRDDPLEKETATHSSILAWKIPWTEEPRGLQSMGSQKSRTGFSS